MLVAVFLGLMLAPGGAKPERIAIYVGPQVREDGFTDVDQGVLDSINDIRKRLRKDPNDRRRDAAFRVVDREADATLKLYVMRRQIGPGPAMGIGSAVAGTGTAISIPTNVRKLETLLRVGDHERPFVVEDHQYDSWGWCASRLVDDLSVWVVANRERIAAKE